MEDTMTKPEREAEKRAHTERGMFEAACHELFLAFHEDAELDGTFDATCLDSGELLRVNGWNYERKDI